METFRGKIKDLSPLGMGVVDHPEGRVFFVAGTWPGDEGLFEIISREKRYGFARFIESENLSEDRVRNPCIHSGFLPGQCGGCAWLGIKYDKQLEQKQKTVEYLARKNLPEVDTSALIRPILASPRIFGYRNRAQLKTEGQVIGYVTAGSKTLAPIKDCIILSDKNRHTLHEIEDQLPQTKWKPKRPYLWNFIEIDEDTSSENLQLNQKTTFKQANTEQNEKMKSWLGECLAGLDKNQTVMELFCGSGNFTKVISDQGFQKIVASEVDAKAITKLNAQNLPGVQGFVTDLFYSTHWNQLLEVGKDTETLVLDPPREGFKGVQDFVKQLPNLKRIFYISCEASHFFQETKLLAQLGWKLEEVQPVDQFPHTPHVELLSVLSK
jgi:23S rRNA (uracil1939-C5)-methyltransferase